MKNSFKIPVYAKKDGRRVVKEKVVEATYIPTPSLWWLGSWSTG